MILIVAFKWQNFCVFLFRNTINRTQPYFGWLLLECSAGGIGFNGAEKNCEIAHILGILLMNSYDT